ncbi:MAG: AAA domain-containing protein [Nitrospirota bacterium]
MSLTDKAQRLFEYISHVYAIDLPVDRDVTKYGAELWWQADIIQSAQCKIKEFHTESDDKESDDTQESLSEDIWLSITKRKYDDPPELPDILKEWVNLSSNPTKLPTSKPSIIRTISFESNRQRAASFKKHVISLMQWEESKTGSKPSLPENLVGWIDEAQLIPFERRDFEEKFDDDKNRVTELRNYIEGVWKLWSERVLPLYKANILYDQLFSLHQRLSVEGDRIEIAWGHLFLSGNYSAGNSVYHPLILTPMNLHFDPIRRNMSLTPSQTIPTKLDLDCLINLDYPFKDELLKYTRIVNSAESPPDAWNHNQMKGFAGTITGYLSKESAEKTNLYAETPCSRPSINNQPTIYNAPLIFVRERTRRLWVDDAKKVADSIYGGANVPPFISSLIADPHAGESPNPENYADPDNLDEDDGENLLPLEYNAQQEEIVKKLRKHFGALVQGPPGTGKSHTIANLVSSLLARGKKVLVTSQTENALKVLRDQIPKNIQSLCVSQLGSDTESKIQLNEAVESIGKHLDKKKSQIVEQKIQQLKKELRAIREEQATLRNQIKDWVELDSCTIIIDGQKITAQQAAKDCSENERNHSWFPDKLSPNEEPPLTEKELIEMCNLLKDITPIDRKSCLQYLPDPKQLLSPEDFSKIVSELKSYKALSAETEALRNEWGNNLHTAERMGIENAINLLEDALRVLQELKHPWQFKVLEFMVSESVQDNYWRDFYNKCRLYWEKAWQSYQASQGYEITVDILPVDTDITAALAELNRHVQNGRNPSGFFVRIRLSKVAKLIYQSIKVDGANLNSSEKINATMAYFRYKNFLNKIDTLWKQIISSVNGPKLDLACAMPLSEIDEKLKAVFCPIEWKNKFLKNNKTALSTLGCRKQILHKQEALEEYLKTLHGQIAEIEKCKIEHDLSSYQDRLRNESKKNNSHNLWRMIADAVGNLSPEQYKEAYSELIRLLQLSKKVEKLESLISRLKNTAPLWYVSLEKKAISNASDAIEKDWSLAWRWRCLNEWLLKLHSRESVESLQTRLERARRKERELIRELVVERTWQRQIASVKDHHYRALTAWADAMRRYGKGTGKYAQRYLASAAKAMVDAVGAVPAWIMPLHRVVQSFQAKPEIFDVVIVDEASQCDLRALPVLFRGRKVLVVGDPEQISPSHIGINEDKVFNLNRQFLSDIPYADTTFLMKNSLYDISKTIPSMDRTLLTEHFRCVPSIIEFNNHLCPTYAGKLEPLRQPNPVEMLDPPINTIFIETGYKDNNDINKPEAEALVELLVKCCGDERYSKGGKNNRKRTMGIISLLGEKQAKYISEIISQRLDETEIAERRIICGDAYAFQGDERDVMFLSLVIASNAQFTVLPVNVDSHRQRFNVATSRARDQVFLFHSIRLNDIRNPECVRYRLLSWYLNPPIAEMEAGKEVLRQKAESQFEIDVGERIIDKGYKVIPQFRPLQNDFNYRIDLVVQGEKNRLAVECDGDRHHGPAKWEDDQRRESQLRRAGWKFWRVSGSTFYRNKEKSLESLWQFLDAEGIEPILFTRQSETKTSSNTDFKNESSKEDIDRKSSDETEKKDYPQGKSTPFTLTPQESQTKLFDKNKIPPISNNWKVWLALSQWSKDTMTINNYWIDFALEISNCLKTGKRLTNRQKEDMAKCWRQALKKGFKIT